MHSLKVQKAAGKLFRVRANGGIQNGPDIDIVSSDLVFAPGNQGLQFK